MPRYDPDTTTLATLLEDPEVVAIFEKHSPGITANPMLEMVKPMSATQAIAMAAAMLPAGHVEAIKAEVDTLE
ncbi:MAG: hypothetical protein V9G19_00255 [Tetrasphaera sp.]